ncbi:MAG: polysaccharide biosynthesis tyrosine autokinase [Chloroflexota bacterium]|nr:polysaccharide biosynthesis tyrosine autokinase [Chloroflexota bacterium]
MTPSTSDQATVYLRLLRKWWWLPSLFGLFSCLAVYGATSAFIKPQYGAAVTLEVVTPGNVPQSSPSDANSDATLLTTTPVLAKAFIHLGPRGRLDPKSLFRATCTADSTDRFVTCQTKSRYPRSASGSLNHLARVFININRTLQEAQFRPSLDSLAVQERQLRSEIVSLQSQAAGLDGTYQTITDQYRLTALQSQISQDQSSLSQLTVQESTLRTEMLQAEGSVRIVDPAVPNPSPVSPHPLRYALLGLIVGLGVAAALVVLLEFLDDRFRSVDEVAEVTGLSVLCSVRRYDGPGGEMTLITHTRPRSVFAEAFRVARTNIQFAGAEDPPRVLMVTSTKDGEGKTTCAANIAIAMAIAGRRVLLVDADLHRAGLSGLLGYHGTPGLSGALSDSSIGIPSHATDIPNLRVVPAGPIPPNPAELLGTNWMRKWTGMAAAGFDVVILDTPPILSVADTRELAALADAVILVVAPEQTSRRLVRQACAALEATGSRVLGVVTNKVTARNDNYSYNTSYYYGPPQPEGHHAGAAQGRE